MRFSYAAIAVLVLAGCGPAETAEPDPAVRTDSLAARINEPLRTELMRMSMLDRTIRAGFTPAVAADTAFLRASLAMDSALSRRLRSIVGAHGWPTRSMVGDDGADAAALILMHSPSDAFQREMLPLLSAAAETGEAGRDHAATLTDRLLTFEGKPQLYGTQFRIIDGTLVPYPIQAADRLDARRTAAGLSTMVDYVELLRQTYGGPVLWPLESVAGPPSKETANPPPDTARIQSPT